jgi:hypothetical protein
MKEDIGRFLDPWILETQMLIKTVFDLATGEGHDVEAVVEGRELAFRRKDKKTAGFLRVLPQATSVSLAFPAGGRLFDPGKRLKGVPGSRLRVVLRTTQDLDPYVRRLIDEAYRIDGEA